MQAESSYYSPQKVKSKEIICWEQEGTTVEVIFHYFPCILIYSKCFGMIKLDFFFISIITELAVTVLIIYNVIGWLQ